MSNLLGAIPALIGVVVGVAATGWADRVRWKRGQAVRWDERRVDVYAEYARAIKRIHMTALRMVSPHMADDRARRINHEDGLAMLAQADAHRTEAWEAVQAEYDRWSTETAEVRESASQAKAELERRQTHKVCEPEVISEPEPEISEPEPGASLEADMDEPEAAELEL